ncbi:MAG TPA: FAD-binding oxidoreductase [Longimicrobiales bacterium]|nr:FAD-binding oxidoreductase [Longimicrobiales bacterium]
MTVTTLTAPTTTLPDLDTLRASLRGPVLLAGDPGYDAARSCWNGMIDRRPAAVARCVGTSDVLACLRYVRAQRVPFTVRAGGHNIAGLCVADGALMIDRSGMRGAWMDPRGRIVHAQPGATLGDIDRETQLHGRATVLGFVSNTGAAGLTLGGGFGYLTRKYGWTCDNVVSFDVITAEGELVHASEKRNPDLFWGLRGGGGNFGIVTGMEYRLQRLGPEITGGLIAWRGEEAAEVLELFRRVSEEAPRELTCVALIRKAPPAPWLPPEMHGKLIVAMLLCHTGSARRADRDLARVLRHGEPVGNVVQRRPYVQQQALLDATQPNGRRYYWKSEYLGRLGDDALEIFRRYGERVTSPHSAMILFQVGGAIADEPDDLSPMGNRDAEYVLNVTGSWESPAEDQVHTAWVREAWQAMKPFSTGGTYVNFQTADEGPDRVRDAYGPHWDQLVRVKRRWDPENLFRANKNIAP